MSHVFPTKSAQEVTAHAAKCPTAMFASTQVYASPGEAWHFREHVPTKIGKAILAHIAVQTVSSRASFFSEGVNEVKNAS